MTVGELANREDSLVSICCTAKMIQPAKPAIPSVHQTVGIAIRPRLRAETERSDQSPTGNARLRHRREQPVSNE